ncbi:DUF262 and DUF1524 domain-containing protein [Helicobacter pylori]|uniref:DUF262 domain-containing protein n=1 Tax=Helicobacter pylori TaxID=210 RepID=A0A1A9HBN6_HELPX|nr:DUF262 and DUF1524 domain-containing protein [Helicobacter pylori]ANH46985.1 hypothetical protein AA973_03875 [Helicobacter pylori]
MEAKAMKLLDFIGKSQEKQFVIPIYQRLYSWEKEQCKQLWDDIVKTGGNDKIEGHFIGSIVFVHDGIYSNNHNDLLIIDGQQRLTTITLLLIALRDHLNDEDEFLGKFSRQKIQNRYLINSDEKGDKKFKLFLSESDRDTLLSLIDKDRKKPKELSLRIEENFKLFQEWISKDTVKLETIFKGLEKLMVVEISLEKGKDNPQLIFESMNSTGKDLTQTDLIRNYILMGLEPKEQEIFYKKYWKAMEEEFEQEERETQFNRFVRHYLTIKTREIPNINEVYEDFKDYRQEQGIEIEALLQDLQKYCGYFCQIVSKKEADKDLNKALGFLVDLKMDVVYPLLLELYSDYRDGVLLKQDFIPIIALTESYICRRAVCGFGTNSLNKVFPIVTKKINKNQYLESVEKHFGSLTAKQRFPDDDEFKEELMRKDFYHFKKNRYFLDRLENFDTKEPVNTQECTIEHIMPQTLNDDWKRDLGQDYERIHTQYLHTIGNLTLTGYNSKYSNESFQKKRDMEKGFKDSPLRLNQSLKDLKSFGEQEILNRTKDLATRALKIWESPKLDTETLEEYKQKGKKRNKDYDLDHYKFSPYSRELFDILSEEIKALDERITEKFNKMCISYKFDTNFVSIVSLKNRLNLFLNMPFHELQDERNLANKAKGNYGNGDIEFKLETKEDIPYCLGLIKQVLEKQRGGRNKQ